MCLFVRPRYCRQLNHFSGSITLDSEEQSLSEMEESPGFDAARSIEHTRELPFTFLIAESTVLNAVHRKFDELGCCIISGRRRDSPLKRGRTIVHYEGE